MVRRREGSKAPERASSGSPMIVPGNDLPVISGRVIEDSGIIGISNMSDVQRSILPVSPSLSMVVICHS
jgi:hypothetical protein